MTCLKTISLLLLCVALSFAGSAGTVMESTGTVFVNGAPAARSSALAPGDKVELGGTGIASITETGAAVTLVQGTRSVLGENLMQLDKGATAIATTKRYAVKAGSFTVTPRNTNARYEVSRLNCRVQITAKSGDIVVSDGTVLTEGHSTTLVEPNCAVAGATPSTPPPAGVGAAGVSVPKGAGIGMGVVGGAAVGSFLAIREGSPSKP